ncbi:YeeE/YedE family protein [Myxosarcina sp. GI1]|uniref:YeeE/YedE family protein n=1 Tax=Myxosarcina sp. GI1 TaxID=1541065 RepID=UPI0005642BA1|nr:YeeE/YedE family protein [Myxosarcina sp. GI1]
MAEVNWISALIGGMLIGLSTTILLAFDGRIAGISSMVNGAIKFQSEENWRWLFIAGMFGGGSIYEYVFDSDPTPVSSFAPVAMIVGGFLVGVGTRMGNGCTSGHGVCGLGRLSFRSLIAVITFIITAILTVFITHHVV